MTLRRLLLLVVCLLALPLWATQPNPSARQRELIDEMLTITHPEDAVRQSLDTMLEQLQKSFETEGGEAADDGARVRRAEGKKDFDRYRELVRESIDYKKIVREIYVPLYAKETLRKELQPAYVKELPEKDSWGTAYAYVVSTERDHYRIVSAGADSVFDWDSRRIVVSKKKADDEDEETPMKFSERLEDDIIYADGIFLQIPRAAQHDR